MEYIELIPSRLFKPFIRCYWSLQSNGVLESERITPDGCPEIILNRADRFERVGPDGSRHLQAEILLVGPIQRAIEIAPTGVVDLFGIRFEPGGLHALLGMPIHEVEDEDLCLGLIESKLRDELSLVKSSSNLLSQASQVEAAFARQFEARGIQGGTRSALGLVGSAVNLIESGVYSVAQLSESLGVNRRALERLFRSEVGLSPKVFARIQRLQNVLVHLDGKFIVPNWTQLALNHGFSDQSHLIREFRGMTGTTPELYLAERTEFSNCFDPGDLSHSSNT
ncbi:MAG: AraC-like DNA-binding protein [Planctomycetota bacterium]